MQKKMVQAFLLAMLCGVCAAADVCPRCGGGVLATDVFCSQCRWRLADAYVQTPPKATKVTASPPTLPPRQTPRPAATLVSVVS